VHTIVHMDIEFDPVKAQSNFKKHGISFEEAVSCLLDPMALAHEDDSIEGEQRWVLLGMSHAARLLTVVYAIRGERIRLISARKATRKETKSYA